MIAKNGALYCLFSIIICIGVSSVVISQEPVVEQQVYNGLLIFLDDSESNAAKNADYFGVVNHGFLTAFMQEAGPVIVSASIVANCHAYDTPKEQDL